MIITCEQCQARFRMADEKLKPGGTKVRCSKCRSVFTVLPPEAAPAEETVDFGAFNMEPVTDEEAAPAAPPAPEPPPLEIAPAPAPAAEPPAPAAGETDLDFSGLEQTLGPGTGGDELAEDFSFADTSVAAEVPESAAPGEAAAGSGFGELDLGAGEPAGELDFDATFAESEEPPAPAAGELDFDATFAESKESPAPAAGGFGDEVATAPATTEFSFETEAPPAAAAEFSFAAEPQAPATTEFSFETEAPPPAAADFAFEEKAEAGLGEFGFETDAAAEPAGGPEAAAGMAPESFDLGGGDSFESSALGGESPFGAAGGNPWEQPEQETGPSFDFDEPSFESKTGERVAKGRDEAGLNFGEIDFAGDEGGKAPAFGAEPDFSQATLARPAEPAAAPPPPPPRPTPARPRGEEPLAAPVLPRSKSPISRVVLLLVLLLAGLCGVGGYFYFTGDASKVVDQLLLKVKGEEPPAPVEQRIGLSIAGSSYVDNREAGQLLVIQGSATNNFTASRSAITVKGLLLDGSGKVLQQQTVFCGNYLSEERLRTMKYAQIEETMNNQFGDSLANMNVKPGTVLRFTIVFRNVPKEMASINVEVVDSKAGGI